MEQSGTNKKFSMDALNEDINNAIEFYKLYNRIIELWPVSESDNFKKDDEGSRLIEKFRVRDVKERSFDKFSSTDDIEREINNVKDATSDLANKIGDIIDDNESELPESITEALNIIYNQAERFSKSYKSRSEKLITSLNNDDIELTTHCDSFIELIIKTVGDFVDETISAIYRGMKMSHNAIYEIILCEVNTFLQRVGIYTYDLHINEKINYDYCTDSNDGTDKDTEDCNLDDVIIDIKQLPYLLADTIVVSKGKVSTWRFKRWAYI